VTLRGNYDSEDAESCRLVSLPVKVFVYFCRLDCAPCLPTVLLQHNIAEFALLKVPDVIVFLRTMSILSPLDNQRIVTIEQAQQESTVAYATFKGISEQEYATTRGELGA
jgi:hypothetical protein